VSTRQTTHNAAPVEWLNDVTEVARRLNCSPRLVRDLISEGQLVPTRIGRRVLVAESDLLRFMRRHREGES